MLKKQSIPNILTLSRGLATLVIIVLFFIPIQNNFTIIFLLFLYATITDFLDGYLARKWKVTSTFGIVFDSLFDKILVLSLLLLLIPYHIVSDILLVVLLVRDLFVDGIKNYMLSQNHPIASIFSGKVKFTFQVIMLLFMLLFLVFPDQAWFKTVAAISALFAALFAYYSCFLYTKIFIKFIRNS